MATKNAVKPTATKASRGLTTSEKAAMRERVKELKGEGEGESAVLEKIKSMQPTDRALAERIHKIVRDNAPALVPKLWYGMPAYANKAGKVVLFFQDAAKFRYRYATLGFQDQATLDEGNVWPTSYALTKLTAADEAKIGALVKKAVS
jgi:uncharacterized protein YdhG (YjbR/CyaY superfamily)